jgi:protein PhnA
MIETSPMTIEAEFQTRSENKCELCSAAQGLSVYEVPQSPANGSGTGVEGEY